MPPDPARAREAVLSALNPLLFEYRPGDDRLVFGDRFALHPLADTAPRHHQYRSGDTLAVYLPLEAREITLIEILVEPTRADPELLELLAGSLWFDAETAALVRAHYRPSRPFDLESDEGEDVPGILAPFQIAVDYLTVEYSLHEGGVVDAETVRARRSDQHRRQVHDPRDGRVADEGLFPQLRQFGDPGGGRSPPWVLETDRTQASDGTLEAVRVMAPPVDSLRQSPLLTGESLAASSSEFSEDELRRIRSQLDALVPLRGGTSGGLGFGWADGNLRYNRVEGLGLGLSTSLGLWNRYVAEPRLMFGVAVGVALQAERLGRRSR